MCFSERKALCWRKQHLTQRKLVMRRRLPPLALVAGGVGFLIGYSFANEQQQQARHRPSRERTPPPTPDPSRPRESPPAARKQQQVITEVDTSTPVAEALRRYGLPSKQHIFSNSHSLILIRSK